MAKPDQGYSSSASSHTGLRRGNSEYLDSTSDESGRNYSV